MLIKALCDYYDYQADKAPCTMPNGYAAQSVSYQVLLAENGEIAAINDYRKTITIQQKPKKNKDGSITELPDKTKKVPQEIALPERSQKTAICSNIIEHRPLYLFGLNYVNGTLTPTDEKDKAKKSHTAFVEQNLAFFEDLDTPICTAYKKFIENWNPEQETENPHLLGLGKEYTNSYFCFALVNDISKSPQDDPAFQEKYEKQLSDKEAQSKSENTLTAVCPILGKELPTARIHDKIKFPGGNSSGCVFVGMKESAYESYGKTQSYNSNISEIAMKKYTSAFNSLVNNPQHFTIIGDMVILYFALEQNDSKECDFFSNFLSTSPKVNVDKNLSEIMAKLRTGVSIDYATLGLHEHADFYIVGLTPNSSRICQKFIIRNSFGKLMEHIAQHQIDLSTAGSEERFIRFSNITKELISPKSTKDRVSPPLLTEIIRAALNGSEYPTELLSTIIRRVKTDHNEEGKHYIKFNATRIGIIKACINRQFRIRKNQKEVIKMSLDVNETNPAYRCGRLFAVLEKIQQDSYKRNHTDSNSKTFAETDTPQLDSAPNKLNTTIVDSYFASACSRPAAVFPKLVALSNHHLKKLDDRAITYYKNLLGEIISEIGTTFPTTLSLENQGRFILGYYQQNQVLYTKNAAK